MDRADAFEAYGVDPRCGDEHLLLLRPDIVLVDAGREEAASLVRALALILPEAKVVAVAMPESEQLLFSCAEAGVPSRRATSERPVGGGQRRSFEKEIANQLSILSHQGRSPRCSPATTPTPRAASS